MSTHVLLNLLKELGKRDEMRGLPSIYLFFATSLINIIIQEQECKLRSEIVWHRFFAVLAFIRHLRSYIAVRKLLV